MPNLPGANNPNTPAPPGSQSQQPSTAPAWWDDPITVAQRVLAIAEFDPQAAGEIWSLYKELTGK